MNPSIPRGPDVARADEDLLEQAHLGHGVPSQDPESAAQFLLNPEESEREADSALMGGGMVAGVAAGAAVGGVVAGPVGVVVGGTVGAVVGALGAGAATTVINPDKLSSDGTAPADAARSLDQNSVGDAQPAAPVNKTIASSAPEKPKTSL